MKISVDISESEFFEQMASNLFEKLNKLENIYYQNCVEKKKYDTINSEIRETHSAVCKKLMLLGNRAINQNTTDLILNTKYNNAVSVGSELGVKIYQQMKSDWGF